ncbi:ADP-ribosylglycohydrolase family protein [Aliagarivorans taiwanensis]|uniref:ADP-ribosylglycohydrolase family protein n=1 Tax=Aliagarivorans taiwanensis TaxID=561966 RepID=UPI000410CDDE|nr:ADP-ribosylglycohydrolase family protein [Aliagarivorans taiwanensis]
MSEAYLKESAQGAMLGLALGDALGTSLEFCARDSKAPVTDIVGGGPHKLKAGEWTDDTAMSLCLSDSYLACGINHLSDQMERYWRWYKQGENSCTGECSDIGYTARSAMERYRANGNPLAGSDKRHTAGNGSLMRIAPVALRYASSSAEQAVEAAAEVSRTTHGEIRSVQCCQYLVYLLHRILNSDGHVHKSSLFANRDPQWRRISDKFHLDVQELIHGCYRNKQREDIASTGFVVDTLEAALWCFINTSTFEEGALLAANLGDDADTVAAVYGQLAGAYYCREGLPTHWLDTLAWDESIAHRAAQLVLLPGMHQLESFNGELAELLENPQQQDEEAQLRDYSYLVERRNMAPGFDWESWPYAAELEQSDPQWVAELGMLDILYLNTYLIKAQRRDAELLSRALQQGLIAAIQQRINALLTAFSINDWE